MNSEATSGLVHVLCWIVVGIGAIYGVRWLLGAHAVFAYAIAGFFLVTTLFAKVNAR